MGELIIGEFVFVVFMCCVMPIVITYAMVSVYRLAVKYAAEVFVKALIEAFDKTIGSKDQ